METETIIYATITDLVKALGGPTATIDSAYGEGWIESLDFLSPNAPLERRNIARIIHMFLCLILKEPDNMDVDKAYHLPDLFDCRTCAGHVMQVYCKGIMEGVFYSPTLYLFGMKDSITLEQLNMITERVFHKEKRLSL